MCPIHDYIVGVRGHRNISNCELVQNSAIRYFLGVHKYTPTLAIVGDMGWESCEARWKICMAQLWNSLLDMVANRLTRKIFLWDKHILGLWSNDICKLFCNYGFGELLYFIYLYSCIYIYICICERKMFVK